MRHAPPFFIVIRAPLSPINHATSPLKCGSWPTIAITSVAVERLTSDANFVMVRTRDGQAFRETARRANILAYKHCVVEREMSCVSS